MKAGRRMKRCGCFFLLLAWTFIFESRLSAHVVGQSYIFLTIEDESIAGRFEVAVSDFNKVLGSSLPTDGTASLEQLGPLMDAIETYLLGHVAIATSDGPAAIRIRDQHLFDIDVGQFVVVDFDLGTLEEPPAYLDIRYSVLFAVEPGHQALLVVEHNWKTGTFNDGLNIALIFGAADIEQRLDLTSSSVWRGFRSLVELGVHHIWIGIDHILFLMALLLPAVLRRDNGAWKARDGFRSAIIQVVKIVTLFTIAHSVTLSLAALNVVQLSSRLVESIIAISIAFAAMDIVVPVFRGRVWLVVFGFGLFHGFGFASVLGTMGIPGKYMALSLLGFNLGVEIGQIAIIAIAFPILFWMRRIKWYAYPFVQVGAAAFIFVSLYWFIERAFEVDLPLGSIVFGLLGIK